MVNRLFDVKRRRDKRDAEIEELRAQVELLQKKKEEQSREGKAFHREENVELRKSGEWTSRMRVRTGKIGCG